MEFGLFFFASNEDPRSREKYRLVLEGARFADRHGFASVWLPERHFSPFGGLYPNPAVLHAGLARETRQVRLRAGSVVLPLHHPLRVAEEWSMVDNLSGGRVDLSIAPGWNRRDFVFYPERWSGRHDAMFEALDELRRLWRGEEVTFPDGDGGHHRLRIFPTPIQPELPIWITAARSLETFRAAGRTGANVLTHLFDHGVDELAGKIAAYRAALRASGHPASGGRVTVMLHTFLGEDLDEVRELVREPFCAYIESLTGLVRTFAKSRGLESLDTEELSAAERREVVNFIFERYFAERALFGTAESCRDLVSSLALAGVDEIACLLDYGVDDDLMLASLPALDELRKISRDLAGKAVAEAPAPPAAPVLATVEVDAVEPDPKETGAADPETIRQRCPEVWEGEELYRQLAERGVEYGSGWHRIERLWRGDGEALARIAATAGTAATDPAATEPATTEPATTEPATTEPATTEPATGPALLEAAFQALPAVLPETDDDASLILPERLGRLTTVKEGEPVVWIHARLTEDSDSEGTPLAAEIRLLGENGTLAAELSDVGLRRLAVAPDAKRAAPAALAREWRTLAPAERQPRLVEELRGRLAAVLGLAPERLDTEAPLTQSGLDSLMAVRLKNRVEAEIGLRLPLVALLEGPSLEELASALLEQWTAAQGPEIEPIPRVTPRETYPTSLDQRRLWFLEQLEENPVYIIPTGLRIEGRVDISALTFALGEIVRRHQALRTTFFEIDGEPMQRVVQPPAAVDLPEIDLRPLPAAEDELRRVARREAERSFDLGRDLLLRPLLVRLGEVNRVLLLTMHHIASDGWSVGILIRELAALYRARVESRPAKLPELPVQYVDYAVWQRSQSRDEELEEHLGYWRQRLGGGVPELGPLAGERPPVGRSSPRGGRLEKRLPSAVGTAVAELARRQGVTLFMALLAAFEALLLLESGQNDFVIGTDSANRERAETEGLIGFFINMLPLRTDLGGDPTFRELLGRVARGTLEAFAHQDVPFERLVEAVAPERRGGGHSPLFRTVFVLQNVPARVAEVPGLQLGLWGFGHETVRFDLSLLVMERGGGLDLTWTFRRDRFDSTSVDELHRRYAALLRAALEDPDRRLDELAVWRQAARQRQQERKRERRGGFQKVRPKKVQVAESLGGAADKDGE